MPATFAAPSSYAQRSLEEGADAKYLAEADLQVRLRHARLLKGGTRGSHFWRWTLLALPYSWARLQDDSPG